MADLEEMMDLLQQKPSPTQKRLVPVATTGPPLVGVSMQLTRVTGPDVETIDRTVRGLPCHIYIEYSVCVWCVCVSGVCVCGVCVVCVCVCVCCVCVCCTWTDRPSIITRVENVSTFFSWYLSL